MAEARASARSVPPRRARRHAEPRRWTGRRGAAGGGPASPRGSSRGQLDPARLDLGGQEALVPGAALAGRRVGQEGRTCSRSPWAGRRGRGSDRGRRRSTVPSSWTTSRRDGSGGRVLRVPGLPEASLPLTTSSEPRTGRSRASERGRGRRRGVQHLLGPVVLLDALDLLARDHEQAVGRLQPDPPRVPCATPVPVIAVAVREHDQVGADGGGEGEERPRQSQRRMFRAS